MLLGQLARGKKQLAKTVGKGQKTVGKKSEFADLYSEHFAGVA
jgi:hypothetical protein